MCASGSRYVQAPYKHSFTFHYITWQKRGGEIKWALLTVSSWLTVTSSILVLKCGIQGGSTTVRLALGSPMVGDGSVKSMLGGGSWAHISGDQEMHTECHHHDHPNIIWLSSLLDQVQGMIRTFNIIWFSLLLDQVHGTICTADTTLTSSAYHHCWISCRGHGKRISPTQPNHNWYHINIIWLLLLMDQVHGMIWGHGQRISETQPMSNWYHIKIIWLLLLMNQVHGMIWGHGQRISETWLMSNDTTLASSDYHYCQIRCTAQYEAKKNQQDKADAQMILTSWAATFGRISQNTERLRSWDHKRSWKMGVMGGSAGCCINPFPAKKTVLLS